MFQVIYFSRNGHTRQVADAIASELDVRAENVKEASLVSGADVIFLGSGCYAKKPDRAVLKFIEANDFKGRQVALFGTSGHGEGYEVKAMTGALKGKGAIVKGSFYCMGQGWLLLMFPESRGHPDMEDLAKARKFAQDMKKT